MLICFINISNKCQKEHNLIRSTRLKAVHNGNLNKQFVFTVIKIVH